MILKFNNSLGQDPKIRLTYQYVCTYFSTKCLFLPRPLNLVDPSTPTELRRGMDGVDDGVLMPAFLPPVSCAPPVLELRREEIPPWVDMLTDWISWEIVGSYLIGDSETSV